MTRLRGVLMLAGPLLVGAFISEKLLPTKKTDWVGRRIIFTCLVWTITAVVFFVFAALYYEVSGQKLW